ncbi:MAG: glycosyltransferase family 4 protein [Aggregatilineales bacterium]
MRVLLNASEEELTFIGGDQTYYRNLAAAGKADCGFTAQFLQHSSTETRKRIRWLEVMSHHVPGNWLKSHLLAESRRVPVTSADLQNIDLVASVILAARLPRHSRIANVFMSQGINTPDYYQYQGGPSVEVVAAYYRHLAPHITTMIVATKDGLHRLQEMCPNLPCQTAFARHLVLTDGLSSLREKDIAKADRLRMLFVGRDYIRKGLPEVLQAYRVVSDAAELHIVSAESCPLKAETADLPNVYWYSRISDETLRDLYRAVHVLFAPTHADTYNLAMVEAMAYGCAVITSDLPPMDEIAPPGIVGEIVPRGNVEALQEVMKRLVNGRDRLQGYMQGALDHFRAEHSPTVVIRDTLAAFEQAIGLVK